MFSPADDDDDPESWCDNTTLPILMISTLIQTLLSSCFIHCNPSPPFPLFPSSSLQSFDTIIAHTPTGTRRDRCRIFVAAAAASVMPVLIVTLQFARDFEAAGTSLHPCLSAIPMMPLSPHPHASSSFSNVCCRCQISHPLHYRPERSPHCQIPQNFRRFVHHSPHFSPSNTHTLPPSPPSPSPERYAIQAPLPPPPPCPAHPATAGKTWEEPSGSALVFVGGICYVLFVVWGSYFIFSLLCPTPSAPDCARFLSPIRQLPPHSPLLRETVEQAGRSHGVHGVRMVYRWSISCRVFAGCRVGFLVMQGDL